MAANIGQAALLLLSLLLKHVGVQAVTKYILGAKADVLVLPNLRQEEINIRDAFAASPGCVLISADYSQVELRVLAHLSRDPQLIHILTQAGLQGDAFALIAKTWLRQSQHLGSAVAMTAGFDVASIPSAFRCRSQQLYVYPCYTTMLHLVIYIRSALAALHR